MNNQKIGALAVVLLMFIAAVLPRPTSLVVALFFAVFISAVVGREP